MNLDQAADALTAEQCQRVVALREARGVLETRGSGPAFGGKASSQPPAADDLLAIADYIVTGEMWLDEGVESTGAKVKK